MSPKRFIDTFSIFLLIFTILAAILTPAPITATAATCKIDKSTLHFYSKNDILYYCDSVIGKTTSSEKCFINDAVTDNSQKILKALFDYGYTATAAAAITANLKFESGGLDPYNLEDGLGNNDNISVDDNFRLIDSNGEKTYSGGFGLAQWTSEDRVKNLQAFADSKGKPVTSLDLQIDFLIHEIESGYKSVLPSSINQISSIDEATTYFMNEFEKPGVPHLETRQQYANEILNGNSIVCKQESETILEEGTEKSSTITTFGHDEIVCVETESGIRLECNEIGPTEN